MVDYGGEWCYLCVFTVSSSGFNGFDMITQLYIISWLSSYQCTYNYLDPIIDTVNGARGGQNKVPRWYTYTAFLLHWVLVLFGGLAVLDRLIFRIDGFVVDPAVCVGLVLMAWCLFICLSVHLSIHVLIGLSTGLESGLCWVLGSLLLDLDRLLYPVYIMCKTWRNS